MYTHAYIRVHTHTHTYTHHYTYTRTHVHTCTHTYTHDNQLSSWTQHDGRTFGKHRVIDKSSEINASFIIADSGEEWTNRIAVKHNTKVTA